MATTKYSVSAYVADGVTTDFLITWDYLDTDHIAVYVDGVSNSDPSSTFQFSQINSTTVRVTDELGNPVASGLDVEIHRETPILNRAVTFIDGSALLAEDLNKNSDYLLFAMQEAIDTVDIAAQNGAEAAQLATETLRDETQVLRDETEGFRDTTLTYRDQTYAYLDSVSADVTTVAGIEADVTTVAANIVAVQNADANATTATTKAAEASASAAAALVSENNSATSANNAATSEANAASSAGSAGSSATSAASSATAASSSASSASSSASAADGSAISASLSEALSEANKDAAGVYAGQAASSASAAAVSAGAAATSETNAAATLTTIEGIYDQFDDRYLGPKASDPTLDNDGNALVQGTMYFSTSENAMKVYDGANWVSATSAGGASLLNYNFTATAGQTTFSGADDNAATLSYTQQNLIVTLNGIVLEDGTDYTASNGTSIVLTTAAAAGDELNVVAFKSFTTADMVPASTGGTFSGHINVPAGASGSQVPQAQEVVKKSGDTMTGELGLTDNLSLYRTTSSVDGDVLGKVSFTNSYENPDYTASIEAVRGFYGNNIGLRFNVQQGGGGGAPVSIPAISANSNGFVTMPYQPIWGGRHSGGNLNDFVTMSPDVDVINGSGWVLSGGGSERLYPPVSGWYQITMTGLANASVNVSVHTQAMLYKNGVSQYNLCAGSSSYTRMIIHAYLYLTPTDWISFYTAGTAMHTDQAYNKVTCMLVA